MSYRDDRDADQAHIEALQQELAAANQRISELESGRSLALVKTSGNAVAVQEGKVPFWGGPLKLELTRTFEGAYPADAFEEIIELAREHMGETGRSELLKSSVIWRTDTSPKGTGPFLMVSLTVRDGRTTLSVHDRLGQLAGALYGGIGGGVGGGGISVPIMIPMALSMPALIPAFVIGWLGTVFLGTRALFKRSAKKRAKQLQTLFDVAAAAVEKKLAARPALGPSDQGTR